jgi:hypothetical protein
MERQRDCTHEVLPSQLQERLEVRGRRILHAAQSPQTKSGGASARPRAHNDLCTAASHSPVRRRSRVSFLGRALGCSHAPRLRLEAVGGGIAECLRAQPWLNRPIYVGTRRPSTQRAPLGLRGAARRSPSRLATLLSGIEAFLLNTPGGGSQCHVWMVTMMHFRRHTSRRSTAQQQQTLERESRPACRRSSLQFDLIC